MPSRDQIKVVFRFLRSRARKRPRSKGARPVWPAGGAVALLCGCFGLGVWKYSGISYKESIDTTTSMGWLIFHINSAYAEFEREIITDGVIADIKAKAGEDRHMGRKMLAGDTRQKIREWVSQKHSSPYSSGRTNR